MNVFEVSIETPIYIHTIKNKYVTLSGETWPSVTGGWMGQKRPFSAWRIYAMAP